MFITLVPSYVAPINSYVANVFVYNPYITYESVCTRILRTRMYPYVTHGMYSYMTLSARILLVSTRLYSYVTRMYSCDVLVLIITYCFDILILTWVFVLWRFKATNALLGNPLGQFLGLNISPRFSGHLVRGEKSGQRKSRKVRQLGSTSAALSCHFPAAGNRAYI